MKKGIKIAGKFIKSVLGGVLDVVLPNTKKIITMKKNDLPDEKDEIKIDWIRLLTAITVWILLILVAMDKIKLSDVIHFLQFIK